MAMLDVTQMDGLQDRDTTGQLAEGRGGRIPGPNAEGPPGEDAKS